MKLLITVLKKRVRSAARNISDNATCIIERRRCLFDNYLSDRAYENKRHVKKALKYELMRCEVETKDKTVGELEDAMDSIIIKYYTRMLIN